MALAAFVLLARGQRVPRKLVPALALLLLVVGGVLMQSACATGGDILGGPKTLTVTGTSGALSHSTPVIVNLP
jgi:TRAP-type mannitol/chloroaromatic compound transport system permease large subunit